MINLDAEGGVLQVEVSNEEFDRREPAVLTEDSSHGVGRELFSLFRNAVSTPEEGACVFF